MPTVRTRLDRGDIKNSKSLLLENIANLHGRRHVPPGCCLKLKPPRLMKCEKMSKFVDLEKFREKCLQCQAEMLYKIGGL